MVLDYENGSVKIPDNIRKILSERNLLEDFEKYLSRNNFSKEHLYRLYRMIKKYPDSVQNVMKYVTGDIDASNIDYVEDIISDENDIKLFYEYGLVNYPHL